MAKLADFLEKLSSDEAFEAKYDADPTGTMEDFGLNPHLIDLVLNGTAKEIRTAVHDEDPSKRFVVLRVKRGGV
jgi:hypothetical protein